METAFYILSNARWNELKEQHDNLAKVDEELECLMMDSNRCTMEGESSFKDIKKERKYQQLDRDKYLLLTKIFTLLDSYGVALKYKDYSPIALKMRIFYPDLKNSYLPIKKEDIEKLIEAAEKAYNAVTYEDVHYNWMRNDWWKFYRDDEIPYDGFYFATTKQFIANMKYLLKTVDFNNEVIVYREGV